MKFLDLSNCYSRLEQTSKKIEMVKILAKAIKDVSSKEIGKIALLTIGKLYPDFVGIELMLAEKMIVKALALATGNSKKTVLKVFQDSGDIGETTFNLLEKKPQSTLLVFTKYEEKKSFTVSEIWNFLDKLAKISGEGSSDKKIKLLSGMLSKVSSIEAKYITRIVAGQIRLGIATQLLLEALALAKTGTKENKIHLERAYNRCSDIGFVAKKLFEKGIEGIQEIKVQIFNPIKVMLAQRVSSSEEMLSKFGGECSLEYKYDGLRVQIHKKGDEIKLFSRKPEDITTQFPDVQEHIKQSTKEDNFIIEGEIVAYNHETGKILSFQHVSQRKRKYNIKQKIKEIPVKTYLFDVLYCLNESTLDLDYLTRRELLKRIVKNTENIQFSHQMLASNSDEIEAFFMQALEDTCEGIMGKKIGENSEYQAGARGWNWVKYKAEYVDKLTDSFDLVIIGADYGKGRRAGKYGTFLLGCFDEEEGKIATFTRVATGFTDKDLALLYKMLKPLEREKPKQVISKIECNIWFEPKVILEISGAEITVSQMHTCNRGRITDKKNGLALRFPRFTGRIVEDKTVEQITSSTEILAIYLNQKDKFNVK